MSPGCPEEKATFRVGESPYAPVRQPARSLSAGPENPVTPHGRLDAKQNELQAVREDIKAIRPPAAAFENALNEVQKKRLATFAPK